MDCRIIPPSVPSGTVPSDGLSESPAPAEAVFFWILIAGKVLFWVARALGPSSCQRGQTAPA